MLKLRATDCLWAWTADSIRLRMRKRSLYNARPAASPGIDCGRRTDASTEAQRLTYFHFDTGGRARNAGRFIGKVRNEFLRALSVKRAESGICQQALATKLDAERALINRQLSGEESLSLRTLADLAWAMELEISFELKPPSASAGQ